MSTMFVSTRRLQISLQCVFGGLFYDSNLTGLHDLGGLKTMSMLDRAMGSHKEEHVPNVQTMNCAEELEKLSHFVDKIRKGLEGRFAWEKYENRDRHDYIGTGIYPRVAVPIVIRGRPPHYIPVIKTGTREMIDTFQIVREKRVDALAHLYDLIHAPISQRDGRKMQGHGRTCLHVACAIGDEHAAYILVARGANPNSRDCFGRTPLFLAARHGHLNCVKLLLAYGSLVNLIDDPLGKNGKTAVMFASEEATDNDRVKRCIDWINVAAELRDFVFGKRPVEEDGKTAQIRPLISGCYVGEHKIHQYHGDGILYLPNGGYLDGQFEDHMACGHGILYREDGSVQYDGTWMDGLRSGIGTENHLNGGKYIGEWLEDKFHGSGKSFSKARNLIYEGTFRDGKRHGTGTLYKKDGTLEYDGSFSLGKMTGRGKRVGNDGSVVEGYFLDGRPHGPVSCKSSRGALLYDGHCVDGKRHGSGKSFREMDNKPLYFGEWQNDKYHGEGVLFSGEGQWEGSFSEGKAHGLGTFTFANGATYAGECRDGCFVNIPKFDLLLQHGFQRLVRQYELFAQVAAGNVKRVESLLTDGTCKVSQRTAVVLGHSTPLHIACYHGAASCVRALLRFGASIDSRDGHGLLPEDIAILNKNDLCVEHILLCRKLVKL